MVLIKTQFLDNIEYNVWALYNSCYNNKRKEKFHENIERLQCSMMAGVLGSAWMRSVDVHISQVRGPKKKET